MTRLLAVCSVEAEANALLGAVPPQRLLRKDVVIAVGGVGPVAAAVSTAVHLGRSSYDLVVSAGIAGGFGLAHGLVLADRVSFADLGAGSPDGFLGIEELGFGTGSMLLDPAYVERAADATGAEVGEVLTVAAATGTASRGAELHSRYPEAIAEAMEGYGVAAAAAAYGVPALELRGISNRVGPRDRASWDLPGALAALAAGFKRLTEEVLT